MLCVKPLTFTLVVRLGIKVLIEPPVYIKLNPELYVALLQVFSFILADISLP